ncbi:MAG: DUF6624 domain-containing protein [Pyrinomonadaceae bacterium]
MIDMMNDELRQRLLAMAEEDQRIRSELAATGELFKGYHPRMEEVHRRNAQALTDVIAEHGWPGKSLVGADGAHAAWLVLQHAIGNPALQRGCLPLLQEAVTRGEMEPAHAAYLEDRIRSFEGRPQRYGTQLDWDEEGRMCPLPLEDPDRVDEYRRAVGLGPLAERVAQSRAGMMNEPRPTPAELQRRRAEMEAWARSVGWR